MYLERMSMFDHTHMMSIDNLVIISVEITRIDKRCSLEQEFIRLLYVNS